MPADEGRAYAVESWFLDLAGGLEKREHEIQFYFSVRNYSSDNITRVSYYASLGLLQDLHGRALLAEQPDAPLNVWAGPFQGMESDEIRGLLYQFIIADKRKDMDMDSNLGKVIEDFENNISHRKPTSKQRAVTKNDFSRIKKTITGKVLIH
jgi:hypothetical protein